MSASMPGCARSTRARCSASFPSRDAVDSVAVSAIHRRRVMQLLSPLQMPRKDNEGDAVGVPFVVAFWMVLALLLAYSPWRSSSRLQERRKPAMDEGIDSC